MPLGVGVVMGDRGDGGVDWIIRTNRHTYLPFFLLAQGPSESQVLHFCSNWIHKLAQEAFSVVSTLRVVAAFLWESQTCFLFSFRGPHCPCPPRIHETGDNWPQGPETRLSSTCGTPRLWSRLALSSRLWALSLRALGSLSHLPLLRSPLWEHLLPTDWASPLLCGCISSPISRPSSLLFWSLTLDPTSPWLSAVWLAVPQFSGFMNQENPSISRVLEGVCVCLLCLFYYIHNKTYHLKYTVVWH